MTLIDIVIVALITILGTKILRAKTKLEIYKDISDLGYKFNHEKFAKEKEENTVEVDIITHIIEKYNEYIPFLNLITTMINENRYYKTKDIYFKELISKGALEEMTVKEKEEYNKRKTGFHALKMEKKRVLRILNAPVIATKDGSAIWFDFGDDINIRENTFGDNIEILKATGRFEKLTKEEQIDRVTKALITLGTAILNSDDLNSLNFNTQDEKNIEMLLSEKKEENIEPSMHIEIIKEDEKVMQSVKKKIKKR